MLQPPPASISTTANFAHSRHRGFRVPNRYSAQHPDDLKTLGANEGITVHNARLLDPPPTLASHVFHTAVAYPTSPPDAPPRSTIEVRMQAIYGEEQDEAVRLSRFLAQIPTHYADGRVCNWWSGPIEGYVPPPGVAA